MPTPESLTSIRKFDVPIEQATTASLEAFKNFTVGVEFRRKGQYAESVTPFKRAIELDGEFALAHAQLGTSYRDLRNLALGNKYLERAYQLRDRVSERERLVRSLGDRSYMILRHHGLLTCGETAAAAFFRMYQLQRACEVQVNTMKMGQELRTLDEAVALANQLAPEHCEVMTRNASKVSREILSAGAIFIGPWTPTVLGDYVAGPSHTLPTGGAGNSFAGLTVDQFQRRTSVVEYSRASLKKALPAVQKFAELEGLSAHGTSAEMRVR